MPRLAVLTCKTAVRSAKESKRALVFASSSIAGGMLRRYEGIYSETNARASVDCELSLDKGYVSRKVVVTRLSCEPSTDAAAVCRYPLMRL